MKQLRKRNIFFLFPIFLFFLIPLSHADNYEHLGGDDRNYYTDSSATITTSAATITALQSGTDFIRNPLVADLNNDGTNEIIIIDKSGGFLNAQIEVYQENTLDLIDSLNMNLTATAVLSNLELSDINNDGNLEIIYFEGRNALGGFVRYMTFNSSDELTRFLIGNSATFGTVVNQVGLSCNNVRQCVSVGHDTTAINFFIDAIPFNFTQIGDRLRLHTDTADQDGACPPPMYAPIVSDYDLDGTQEFIVSSMIIDDGRFLMIKTLELDSLNLSDFEVGQEENFSFGDDVADGTVNCEADGYMFYHSNILVMDTDGTTSNGLEFVVAAMEDPQEWKIYQIESSTMTELDDYPELTTINAEYSSNPVTMRASSSTDGQDFCVSLHNVIGDDTLHKIICGSNDFGIGTSYSYYDYNSVINYTPNNDIFNLQSHSIKRQGQIERDIITFHGLIELDYTEGENDTAYIWESAVNSAASSGYIIPVDYDNINRSDMLVLASNTQLYYIDDGFTNSDCLNDGCLTSVVINPCNKVVWKNNTLVGVSVTASDVDDDNIQLRVTLYDGRTFNQTNNGGNFSGNYSSGSTVPFNFWANVTGNNHVLKVEVRDSENLDDVETESYIFSVASTGIEYGDETCIYTFVDETTTTPIVSTSATQDIVSGSVSALEETTGFTAAGLWYLVLVIFLAATMYRATKTGGDLRAFAGLGLFASGVWILFGVLLSVLEFGHLLAMMILLLGSLAFSITYLITGRGGGG